MKRYPTTPYATLSPFYRPTQSVAFAANYKLRPLNEVEAFVKANKHLPGVPSAQEVVTEGVDMAKMDAKLLQKVEELRLYMIQLKKDSDRRINRLEKENLRLKQLIRKNK